MKVICNGLDLSNAVMRVARAIGAKSPNAILEGIKLVAIDDFLILTATDGELSIEKKIRADIMQEGQVVVPGKFFSEYVKRLVDGDIELVLDEKNKLNINYTGSTTSMQCLRADEYPIIKTVNLTNYFSMQSKKLKNAIDSTIFSVAGNDGREGFRCEFFKFENNLLDVFALDGFRLGVRTTTIEESTMDNFELAFPTRSIKEISSIIESTDEIVKIYFDANYSFIEIDDTKIVSRLVETTSPRFRYFFKPNHTTVVKMKKSVLEDSLDQGIIIARRNNEAKIQITINEGLLKLESVSDLYEWKDVLAIELDGADVILNLNMNYLRDCIKAIETEYVQIILDGGKQPCFINDVDNPENENTTYMIIPIRAM